MEENNKRGPKIKEDPKPVEQKPRADLKDIAMGLTKLSTGKYAIVKINYNFENGEVGNLEGTPVGQHISDAEYEFRDAVDLYLQNFFVKED